MRPCRQHRQPVRVGDRPARTAWTEDRHSGVVLTQSSEAVNPGCPSRAIQRPLSRKIHRGSARVAARIDGLGRRCRPPSPGGLLALQNGLISQVQLVAPFKRLALDEARCVDGSAEVPGLDLVESGCLASRSDGSGSGARRAPLKVPPELVAKHPAGDANRSTNPAKSVLQSVPARRGMD
jgi:hypothetical protein